MKKLRSASLLETQWKINILGLSIPSDFQASVEILKSDLSFLSNTNIRKDSEVEVDSEPIKTTLFRVNFYETECLFGLEYEHAKMCIGKASVNV
jgi:hypothetical protein